MKNKFLRFTALLAFAAVIATVAPAGAATFSHAVSWWRGQGLNDEGGEANSFFVAYGSVEHSVPENIPGVGSNNRLISIEAGGDLESEHWIGADNEWSTLHDDLTVFTRFRFDDSPDPAVWHNVFRKREAHTNGLFILQYDAWSNYSRFGYNPGDGFRYVGTTDTTAATLSAGTWYDMVGVFKEGEGGYMRVVLTETATANVLFDHTGAANLTNASNVAPDSKVKFSDPSMGNISMESSAIWGSALSDAEIRALTIPEPGTMVLLGIAGAFLASLRRRKA